MTELGRLWAEALALKPPAWALTLTQAADDSALVTLMRPDGFNAHVEASIHRSDAVSALTAMLEDLRGRSRSGLVLP